MPGAFVVFEGGDGAGKSTQCRLLADALRARGHEVVVTREPGGTPIGEAIREVLLGAGSDGMAARTEALLFAAARAEHAAALIRPAVARGAVVISDRYLDSSVAYQGAARGLGEDRIAELSLWATEGLRPRPDGPARRCPRGRSRPCRGCQPDGGRAGGVPRRGPRTRSCAGRRRRPERYLVLEADRPKDEVAAAVLAAVLDDWPHPAPAPTPSAGPPDRSGAPGRWGDPVMSGRFREWAGGAA